MVTAPHFLVELRLVSVVFVGAGQRSLTLKGDWWSAQTKMARSFFVGKEQRKANHHDVLSKARYAKVG